MEGVTPEEAILAAWDFMDGMFCHCPPVDAHTVTEMLSLFPEAGPIVEMVVEGDKVIYLDTGDALGMTIWWRQTRAVFLLGVVGDDEGSIQGTWSGAVNES